MKRFWIYSFSTKEKKLLSLLKDERLSISHSWDHLENVLQYCLKLSKLHKTNLDYLIPAVLLHDLGRSKQALHGKASIKQSLKKGKILLIKAGYKPKEQKEILKIISEHDQPELKNSSLSSQILKEADFLDGFGARGLSRALSWMGESRKDLTKNLYLLKNRMKKRFESLQFNESVKLAEESYLFSQLFFNELELAKKPQFKGKLIVFEGVSGTGKETQAKKLKFLLESSGRQCQIIYHPTQRLKKTLIDWRKDKIDLLSEAFLFVADRLDSVMKTIIPALGKKIIVISLRNTISTLVYQTKNVQEQHLIEYLYGKFEPQPDLIFYFDLDPKIALKRVNNRINKTNEKRGKFENLKELIKKRAKYQRIIISYKNVIWINANFPKEKIFDIIKKEIARII